MRSGLKQIILLGTLLAAAIPTSSVGHAAEVRQVSHRCSANCVQCVPPCVHCPPASSPNYSAQPIVPPTAPGAIIGDPSALNTNAADANATPQLNLDVADVSADSTSLANQFAAVSTSALSSSSDFSMASIGGYIEPATVRSRFRVSWSDFKDSTAPDRAQYFYGYASSFDSVYNTTGVVTDDLSYDSLIVNLNDVQGAGAVPIFRSPSFSELRTYFEFAAPSENWSVFFDLPFRKTRGFNFFGADDGVTGIGDLQVGTRVSLIRTCDFALTAIGKGFLPTGNASRARGTGHGSIEFGVLFQKQRDRFQVFGQLTDWISTEDTVPEVTPNAFDVNTGQFVPDLNVVQGHVPGHANVLQYGIGFGYQIYESCNYGRRTTITPVMEVVGWSVLDGKKSDLEQPFGRFVDADGDFIVNGKYGVRATSGQGSFYAGYGHNWTTEHWYREIVRLEYSRNF